MQLSMVHNIPLDSNERGLLASWTAFCCRGFWLTAVQWNIVHCGKLHFLEALDNVHLHYTPLAGGTASTGLIGGL